MQSNHTNAELTTAKDGEKKTYRLTASSIVRYEAIVEAKDEQEAWEVAVDGNVWEEIEHSGDWLDESCEEFK